MKRTLILALVAVLPPASVFAGTSSVDVGTAYVYIDGIRSYAATGSLYQDGTKSLAAPYIRYTYTIPDWSVGVGYTYYSNLKWSGTSPTSDIFHEGGATVTTPTSFGAVESIHELSVDARYLLPLTSKLTLGFGPTISYFRSRATVASRFFSDTQVRFGGGFRLQYNLTAAWGLGVGYRYAHPIDRDLHLGSVELSYRF